MTIIQEAKLRNAKWVSKRIDELTLIDEKIMIAIYHSQLYGQKMNRSFHKRVKAKNFEIGQLVVKCLFPYKNEYKGKFAPNCQGPYMVRKLLCGCALILSDMDGTVWPK